MLQALYKQLPQPVPILGDFNAYDKICGSTARVPKEEWWKINFAEVNEFEILYSGAPTRIGYNAKTCMDLTLATPTLEPLLEWTTTATPRDTDHLLIGTNILNTRHLRERADNK